MGRCDGVELTADQAKGAHYTECSNHNCRTSDQVCPANVTLLPPCHEDSKSQHEEDYLEGKKKWLNRVDEWGGGDYGWKHKTQKIQMAHRKIANTSLPHSECTVIHISRHFFLYLVRCNTFQRRRVTWLCATYETMRESRLEGTAVLPHS